MTLLVVGTIPAADKPLCTGSVAFDGESLTVGGDEIPACQGTAALLLAALAAAASVDAPPPIAVLGRDIGRGDGTRAAYDALPEWVERTSPSIVTFHYLQPVMTLMRRAIEMLEQRSDALLVGDAGGMYAARGAGLARKFELMTPDVGEVGFMADSEVTHPAYVSHYLFGQAGFDAEKLARLAWETGGSSRVLLVKGATDRIFVEGEVVATVSHPDVPTLEAIGGTGDTITGLCAGLMSGGVTAVDAALVASRCNRLAGERIGARPHHRACDLAAAFPKVLSQLSQ
jgi:ADP-dependent NAD(P)H-hydrate dehydratase / NAD(P)H-hydrate epimerase